MANGKDQLINQPNHLVDNYDVKPSQFPSPGGLAHGYAEGKDQLSKDPDCPRTLEDGGWGPSGAGTPSVWGKGGKAFPVQKNGGEAGEASKSVSLKHSVNLATGHIEPALEKVRNREA